MSLDRFRIDAPEYVAPAVPGAVEMTQRATVLAFDQSLADLGWVLLEALPPVVIALDQGTIRTPKDDYPKGHEGSLRRAEDLHDALRPVFLQAAAHHDLTAVVHEMPPVGARMSRPESSLLSALAVRLMSQAVLPEVPRVIVANQHSKSVLVGNGNATKKQWHEGLRPYAIHLPNEATRDAGCLGLTYLIDQERAR